MMDFSESKGFTCEQAREIDLIGYLSTLGYEPARIKGHSYWYLSPFRNEKTPSFKVNRQLNRWYDFGEGKGGNLVDFGVLYFRCSVADLLQNLSGKQLLRYFIKNEPSVQESPAPGIVILKDTPLHSAALYKYLSSRKIDLEIATEYCREVRFKIRDKEYFAIGFKNDAGGFELRNPWFKGSSTPKRFTSIFNSHPNISVFEGFMDFLSYQTFFKNVYTPDEDYLILNSLSFFEQARPFMEEHEHIFLHFDHDNAGQNCRSLAASFSNRYHDASGLYYGYKDLNEWLMATTD